MDEATILLLNKANRAFYRNNAESFSLTRHAPWKGWHRVLRDAMAAFPEGPSSVLDIACGNCRFEGFLADELPQAAIDCHVVDGSRQLMDSRAPLPGRMALHPRQVDIVSALAGGTLASELPGDGFDLVACFGFMHHVPGGRNRSALLDALIGKAAPGGCIALSFWRFMESGELARRAQAAHARGLDALERHGLDRGQLEPGDYLLGWQETKGSFRYCHSFSDAEIDSLAAAAADAGAAVADRFSSDGRTGALNTYLVLRRA